MTAPTAPATAAALGDAYASGALRPVDVAREALGRMDQQEPVVNAMWVRDPAQEVLARAEESTRRWEAGTQRGPLDGVPVTLKENIARAGVPMPSGTAGAEPVVPTVDSPVARRVDEAGMVVLGSTVMPDWGMLSSGVSSLHGITRSPLDPRWTTGGSSSGAGAAVAAGYAPLAVGTDIGGSIRLPGTWLGLATLKPSAGRIPLHAPYLGRAAGPMARTAQDCAALMAVLSGPDPVDWTSLPGQRLAWDGVGAAGVTGLRVGVWTCAGYGVEPEPEVVAAVRASVDALADGGAEVVEVGPWLTQDLLDGVNRFWQARSWADFARLGPEGQERVLPYVADWVRAASGLTGTEVVDAYHAFGQVQARTVAAWAAADLDLLVSPVAPCAAFPAEQPMPYPDGGRGMWHINFTMPWNMTGQPAGTTRAGAMPDGRPVGVQVVGRAFDDVGVLGAMAWLEARV